MTRATAIADLRTRKLLGEATAWRLLGLLFERPREGWREQVEGLSEGLDDPEIRAAADAAREGTGEGLYLALLGPGSVVSPREVAHRGMADPGRILSDIMAFYKAFAFRPEAEDPPDHVALEAGFMGYLCLKEAYARSRGSGVDAEVAAQAAERFRQEHLSALAWPLADRLEKAGVRYLALAARALAHRSGPRPAARPAGGSPLPPCDPDCPLDCGKG